MSFKTKDMLIALFRIRAVPHIQSGTNPRRRTAVLFNASAVNNFRSFRQAAPINPPLVSSVRIRNRKGDEMVTDTILDGLSKEIESALKALSKTKDINEKEAYSRIIKNLCESQGVFLKLASEMMPFDDDIEEEDIPF